MLLCVHRKRRSDGPGTAPVGGDETTAPLATDDPESPLWCAALTQVSDLKCLLGESELSEELARVLAARWGTSVRTVWRRVRAFRREPSVRGVMHRRRGAPPGVGRMSSGVEAVIQKGARESWKQSENATIAEIYPVIARECAALALRTPSRSTVARRLAALRRDPSNFSSDVAAKLRDRTRLVKSSFTVGSALAVVQIDHTIADVFIVDPISRACIGRPTLTVALDVATRCVLGMCLALEAPSALLVALCLEHAVGQKEHWLEHVGASADWPVFGIPRALHVDNGQEFHSSGFRRGCDLNGIDTIYRPPATPRFGGHVERLIGTLMRHVRLLPGSSYSDLLRARPRHAERRATLSLSEVGGFMVEDISRYHRTTHRALGRSPLAAWEQSWIAQKTDPRIPRDLRRFRLDFLPLQQRVVGREGIELFGLKYSCAELEPEIHLAKRRVVRFDPRDLSRVYLERRGAEPLEVPLRDRRLPVMSMWELKAIRRSAPRVLPDSDPEALRDALKHATVGSLVPTRLRSRRQNARRRVWQQVQALSSLPAADTRLEVTVASEDVESLPWEVLE
jgi:putative transposase